MKKLIPIFLSGLLAVSVLAGCGNDNSLDQSISSAASQTNTTKHQVGSVTFRVDSGFTSKVTSDASMVFFDEMQETYISVSQPPNTSIEDAKKEIEDGASLSPEMDVTYSKQETIHGINGFHVKVENKTNQGANFANSFLFETKDGGIFSIIYTSKSLNSNQIDEKLKEIIATVEF